MTFFFAQGLFSGIYIKRLFNGCSPILYDRLPLIWHVLLIVFTMLWWV